MAVIVVHTTLLTVASAVVTAALSVMSSMVFHTSLPAVTPVVVYTALLASISNSRVGLNFFPQLGHMVLLHLLRLLVFARAMSFTRVAPRALQLLLTLTLLSVLW